MKTFNCRMLLLKIGLVMNAAALVLCHDYSPGESTPAIEIKVGDSANITCRMNPHVLRGRNASDLYFTNTVTEEVVPSSHITIVNESAIVYMLRNASAQESIFLCRCGADAIMETPVSVGWAPQPVLNFDCHSYDFEYMECKFMRPYNPVHVTYNLTFYINNKNYSFMPDCSYEKTGLVACNMTRTHNYNPHVELYHFTLLANSTLGSLQQNFHINNRNVMIPAAPGKDLKVLLLTSNSTIISWRMHKYESYRSKGLQWQVRLLAQNNTEFEVDVRGPLQRNGLQLHLNNLPYAFYNYTLNLRVKVSTSHVWSETFVHKFQTLARCPDRPPRTNAGSFYIDPTETTVRLYWEELEMFERNGDHFEYVVSEVTKNGLITTLKAQQIESNSALFGWDKSAAYKFEIRSKNNVGQSLEASYIHVPAMLNPRKIKNSTPISIHNVYHATNRTYTLSWLLAANDPHDSNSVEDNMNHLNSYTVYWCQSKRALQNECKGSIHFKEVPANQHRFTTEPQSAQQEHTLNLAVSANYDDFNTGMHWTTCTLDVNSDLIKMEPEARVINASVINVQWSSESVCPSILLGYNLTYCAVSASYEDVDASEQALACSEPSQTISISDQNAKRFNIENLVPYTLYRIEMNMYSRTKVGKLSDGLYVRTGEAAPTPPRQLQVSHIGNTSAVISWLPPQHANGNITHYVVHLNDEEHAYFEAHTSNANELMEQKLENLLCNQLYKIYLTAHTVASSEPSNDVEFMTLIGYPQVPGIVTARSDVTNDTLLEWSRPLVANGNVEFYEVAVTQLRNDKIVSRRISIVNGTACSVSIPTCTDNEYKTKLDVRAVNVASVVDETVASAQDEYDNYEGNEDLRCLGNSASEQNIIIQKYFHEREKYSYYRSDWQYGPNYNCAVVSRLSRNTMVALLVVVSTLGVMVGLYLARQKYNKMANINCTLPPGLDIYLTKDGGFASSAHECESRHINVYNSGGGVTGIVSVGAMHTCHGDSHGFHNEKHHLLASIGNDSGYLDEVTAAARTTDNACGIVLQLKQQKPPPQQQHTPIPTDYMRSHSQCSSDSLVGSNASTAEAEICETDLEVGYIKAEKLGNSINPNNYISDYVAVESLQDKIPTSSSCSSGGHQATTSQAMKNSTPSDYTTLERVAYMSGYVKPGELNAFGHQQQQQQQQQYEQKQQQNQCIFD